MTKIGFIGTGQMAQAMARGFIEKSVVTADNLFGYDLVPRSLESFEKLTGSSRLESVEEIVDRCDLIILAVKPQQMGDVLEKIAPKILPVLKEKLILTIAAGLPICYYESFLSENVRLARVMPNTPCLVGMAASAFALSEGAIAGDSETVRKMLSSVGVAHELPEKLLDAVTGLSGSGPAYVFMMLEAMADGGVRMGLPRNVALDLAAMTIQGAAKLFLTTGEHPGTLKDRVTSPGGTTIAGIATLEKHQFRGAIIAAIESATRRSEELAAQKKS